jgi:hypothetical protein
MKDKDTMGWLTTYFYESVLKKDMEYFAGRASFVSWLILLAVRISVRN